MKVLIAGGAGYIGSRLTVRLLERNDSVVILDAGFFGNAFSVDSSNPMLTVVTEDIRTFNEAHLLGVDAVVDLAGLSSDAAAAVSVDVTEQINHHGSVRLAMLSKKAGVKRYIYSSSCSVYGAADGIVSETSKLNPVTKYAQTKIASEGEIKKISDNSFHTTILRNATVYGLSERQMRFDLIVNKMTLDAFMSGTIQIFGSGTLWRPLIHIDDLIDAYVIVLDTSIGSSSSGEIFNVGSNDQNFTVREIAEHICAHFPGTSIKYISSNGDQRSYRVNFDKFSHQFKNITQRTIDDGIREITNALTNSKVRGAPESDRGEYTMSLVRNGKLR